MAKAKMGGFALIATVLDTPDDAVMDPKIPLFYAAPNPVIPGVAFSFYWTTENVPKVQVQGPSGFDTGILTSDGGGAYVKVDGITADSIFTITGLDEAGMALMLQGSPVAQNLRVTLR